MNYCVITHAFGIARHKPEGQVPLQYPGLSYATITHVLEFSNKAREGGGDQGQKLISSRKEGDEMGSLFGITHSSLQTIHLQQEFEDEIHWDSSCHFS